MIYKILFSQVKDKRKMKKKKKIIEHTWAKPVNRLSNPSRFVVLCWKGRGRQMCGATSLGMFNFGWKGRAGVSCVSR